MEDLAVGLLAGLVGSAYVLYGRRQAEPRFIVCGFALVAYPYVVTGPFATVAVGLLLAALPVVMP